MSTQRGNAKKGAQKYQNKTAFKNDLHDRTPKMQQIKKVQVTGACQHCTDVIEWKIKYRKFKPLTTAKKCTKCLQKTVKQSYFIMCVPCMTKLQVCGKCGQKTEIAEKPGVSEAEQMSQQSQSEAEIEFLTERQRRQFLRLQASGKLTIESLKNLKDSDDNDFFNDDDEEEEEEEEEEDDLVLGTKTEEKLCDTHAMDNIDMNKLKIETTKTVIVQ
ncbi:uncharacterized protein C9orf85 homolog [Ylistrum balloti]|uniref:uncharacterized protein C9orf85 homolog n=1 Tax=Ylistrum balloti TaxID=509963 RepID=UPI002905ACA0|nr:uncharacterized protein C9orf85 homolog [Ylistrum balloti]